jgi:hypothetical protein
LFSGDHTYQFQAIQRIKKQVLKAEEEMEDTKKMLVNEKKWSSFLRDLCLCKDYKARRHRIASIEQDYKSKIKYFEKFFRKASEKKTIKPKMIKSLSREAASRRNNLNFVD